MSGNQFQEYSTQDRLRLSRHAQSRARLKERTVILDSFAAGQSVELLDGSVGTVQGLDKKNLAVVVKMPGCLQPFGCAPESLKKR